MNTVNTWQGALTVSWSHVWSSFLQVLPAIIGAILIFAVGLILSHWVRRFVIEILKVLKVEKISAVSGIDKYLSKADIKLNLIELVGTVFEWLVIYIFFLAFVDILGLTSVAQVLTRVLGYIPNIFAAALIFVAGYFVANLTGDLVRGSLVSVDRDVAKPVGKVAKWLVLVVAFFAAFDQLQIARGLISTFFQGLTYTIVLAVGLSVGLGAKDLVSKVLNGWYDKVKK